MFLLSAIRWIPRLEVVRFRDTLGRTLFDVVKERSYGDEFEAFIECLRDRIKNAPASEGPV